jgi:hypothetical protein
MKSRAIAIIALLVPALAHAQGFEAMAERATTVSRLDDIVWAFTGACTAGDDIQQRQCRLVRDKRAKALAGVTLDDGDSDGAGAWNPQKKSVAVTISACVHCSAIDVEGRAWSMVGGQGVEGAGPRRAAQDNAPVRRQRRPPRGRRRSRWRASSVGQVPRRTQVASASVARDTLAFDMVAWRVVNPCNGSIVLSSVPSAPGEPDKKACDAATNAGVPLDGADALTPGMVQDAMRPVVASVRQCASRVKITGRSKLEITINGDGTIAKHELTGDLVKTPVAKCIDEAMRTVTFPKTKKPTTKIGFPIVL